jgi:ABC-2 type transport system ATP-binding protein
MVDSAAVDERRRRAGAAPDALLAEGLCKSYGATVGVEDVDLRVRPGERFGFLGPNGAGKTTFIRLALGLLRPSAGRIAVMGIDMAHDRLAALEQIGYLPGELGLIGNITGERTLDGLSSLVPRPPVLREELLEVLDLDRADLRRAVRQYSRGMKQKLGLVAALQHDPPLMILDEPTGGLDPVVQERLVQWLRERAEMGRTLFFSSHVLSEVEQLCERVAMIRDGRLVELADVEALKRRRGRIVTISFAEPVEPGRYWVDGARDLTVEGSRHRFTLTGDPAAFLARVASLPVSDISIEAPRLEDLFRSTYVGRGDR